MIKYLALFLCVAVAFGARERRQATCTEPAVNNVCQLGNSGPLHFPHPTDQTKFLQCAPGGRMFIIKCPANEVYHQDTTSCGSSQPVVTVPPQTAAPVTQAPSTSPCTAQNIASGNIFFPVAGDNQKFIECTAQGQSITLTCPTRLVYDPARTGCILPTGSTLNTGGSSQTGSLQTTAKPVVNPAPVNPTAVATSGNPCAASLTSGKELFFPHPNPTKFFQCDLAGNAFIKQCPANLVWNQAISRCDTPYNLAQTQNIG